MTFFNFGIIQIAQTGIRSPDVLGNQQFRNFDGKMSNFGSLSYGDTDPEDYTRFAKSYSFKDNIQNPEVPSVIPKGEGKWSNTISNPYTLGSTTSRTPNDKLIIMSLGTRTPSLPRKDVMDTKVVSNTVNYSMVLNFPAEGYSSFGKNTRTLINNSVLIDDFENLIVDDLSYYVTI